MFTRETRRYARSGSEDEHLPRWPLQRGVRSGAGDDVDVPPCPGLDELGPVDQAAAQREVVAHPRQTSDNTPGETAVMPLLQSGQSTLAAIVMIRGPNSATTTAFCLVKTL